MYRFKVWAPLPKSVALQLNNAVLPMHGPDEKGCWSLEVDAAPSGTEYGFLLDDDPMCYPDPRSLWQPHGVHGLSRVYDQTLFPWSDSTFQPPPLASAVFYEFHIGTFTPEGTLDAAIDRLDHLVELGITHIELMPVAAFTGNHGWGYDGVALFAVHEPYGGPDALKRFVDAAHAKNLSVVLDVVYNHFGPVGNYAGKFGPYLIESHKTPWGGAVNLEEAWSTQVRRFLCDNALMWMRDFHIDGLRLDAVHAFIDRSAIPFLEQLSAEVAVLSATVGRRLVVIAESDLNDPRVVTPREAGGMGMDAQWSDDFHHALFTVLQDEVAGGYYEDFGKLSHLAKALESTFVYDGIFSGHRNRAHGRPAGRISQHRFFGFIQNHDQIGNRAVGDRIHDVVGMERAKIAAAVVLLSPFIPMIFEGEEWAASTPFQYFADHEDPELARLVAEGRKREFAAFGWDPNVIPNPEKMETFEQSKLKWDEIGEGSHGEMLAWYRDLIHLRRSTPDLNDAEPGNTKVRYDEDAQWFSMQRGGVTLHCNLGEASQRVPVADTGDCRIVLSSDKGAALEGKDLLVPHFAAVITISTEK